MGVKPITGTAYPDLVITDYFEIYANSQGQSGIIWTYQLFGGLLSF